MVQILEIHESVLRQLNWSEAQMQFFLMAKLYEAGFISSGKAAESLQLSQRTFLESLHLFNVSVLPDIDTDLDSDVKAIERMLG